MNPLKASLRRENEDQAKMERASSSSREQQPTIQDSEFKSGPAVEDPFLGFLLDNMPFASVFVLHTVVAGNIIGDGSTDASKT